MHNNLMATGIGSSQIVLKESAGDVGSKREEGMEDVPMNSVRSMCGVDRDDVGGISSPSVRNSFGIGRDVIGSTACYMYTVSTYFNVTLCTVYVQITSTHLFSRRYASSSTSYTTRYSFFYTINPFCNFLLINVATIC